MRGWLIKDRNRKTEEEEESYQKKAKELFFLASTSAEGVGRVEASTLS